MKRIMAILLMISLLLLSTDTTMLTVSASYVEGRDELFVSEDFSTYPVDISKNDTEMMAFNSALFYNNGGYYTVKKIGEKSYLELGKPVLNTATGVHKLIEEPVKYGRLVAEMKILPQTTSAFLDRSYFVIRDEQNKSTYTLGTLYGTGIGLASNVNKAAASLVQTPQVGADGFFSLRAEISRMKETDNWDVYVYDCNQNNAVVISAPNCNKISGAINRISFTSTWGQPTDEAGAVVNIADLKAYISKEEAPLAINSVSTGESGSKISATIGEMKIIFNNRLKPGAEDLVTLTQQDGTVVKGGVFKTLDGNEVHLKFGKLTPGVLYKLQIGTVESESGLSTFGGSEYTYTVNTHMVEDNFDSIAQGTYTVAQMQAICGSIQFGNDAYGGVKDIKVNADKSVTVAYKSTGVTQTYYKLPAPVETGTLYADLDLKLEALTNLSVLPVFVNFTVGNYQPFYITSTASIADNYHSGDEIIKIIKNSFTKADGYVSLRASISRNSTAEKWSIKIYDKNASNALVCTATPSNLNAITKIGLPNAWATGAGGSYTLRNISVDFVGLSVVHQEAYNTANDNISFVFNDDLEPSSLTTKVTFGSAEVSCEASYDPDSRRLTLHFPFGLAETGTYLVTVSGHMTTGESVQCTAGFGGIAATGLRRSGLVVSPNNKEITVNFNQEIDPTTIGGVALTKADGNAVIGAVAKILSSDLKSIILKFGSQPAGAYQIVIPTSLKSASGEAAVATNVPVTLADNNYANVSFDSYATGNAVESTFSIPNLRIYSNSGGTMSILEKANGGKELNLQVQAIGNSNCAKYTFKTPLTTGTIGAEIRWKADTTKINVVTNNFFRLEDSNTTSNKFSGLKQCNEREAYSLWTSGQGTIINKSIVKDKDGYVDLLAVVSRTTASDPWSFIIYQNGDLASPVYQAEVSLQDISAILLYEQYCISAGTHELTIDDLHLYSTDAPEILNARYDSTNKKAIIDFSEELAIDSVADTAVIVKNAIGIPVAGTKTYINADRKIEITFAESLAVGDYTVSFSGITSKEGLPVSEMASFAAGEASSFAVTNFRFMSDDTAVTLIPENGTNLSAFMKILSDKNKTVTLALAVYGDSGKRLEEIILKSFDLTAEVESEVSLALSGLELQVDNCAKVFFLDDLASQRPLRAPEVLLATPFR